MGSHGAGRDAEFCCHLRRAADFDDGQQIAQFSGSEVIGPWRDIAAAGGIPCPPCRPSQRQGRREGRRRTTVRQVSGGVYGRRDAYRRDAISGNGPGMTSIASSVAAKASRKLRLDCGSQATRRPPREHSTSSAARSRRAAALVWRIRVAPSTMNSPAPRPSSVSASAAVSRRLRAISSPICNARRTCGRIMARRRRTSSATPARSRTGVLGTRPSAGSSSMALAASTHSRGCNPPWKKRSGPGLMKSVMVSRTRAHCAGSSAAS